MSDDKPTSYTWSGQCPPITPLGEPGSIYYLGQFPGGRTFPPGTGAPATGGIVTFRASDEPQEGEK